MKKPIILVIVAVCIVIFSVAFYYDKVEFYDGEEAKTDNIEFADVVNKEEKSIILINDTEVESISEPEINNAGNDITACNENGKIMVLMYHKFAEKSSDGWTRSLSDFKKDLQLLYDNDYYPINMGDYIEGKIDVPYGKTPVILTFDDGTAGQLSFEWVDDKFTVKKNTAVNIYQEFVEEHPDFPMKGTFYIMSTNFFGSKGTFKQRLEYLVNLGFEIGNQTQNHYALQNASSADKVVEEVGGLAKFVDDLIPGYKITSFSIPGGSMTKKYAEQVYSGEYKGYNYENKGIVLLYSSKPALSPIDKGLDLKKISRIRVSGNEKLDNDLEYWVEYFKTNPEEKYISDGDKDIFVVNATDKENVNLESGYNITIK